MELSDEWLAFLKGARMTLGVSIDGPAEVHDLRRLDRHGKGTSDRIGHNLERLRKQEISHAALAVVDMHVKAVGPERLFEYFTSIGLREIEFLNLTPGNAPDGRVTPMEDFVPFSDFVTFLTEAYRVWQASYADRIKVRWFDDLENALKTGGRGTSCYFTDMCTQYVLTLEPNGILGACDKYIGAAGFQYGNLMTQRPCDLFRPKDMSRLAPLDGATGVSGMKLCRWYGTCNGGCPHDRIASRHLDKSYNGTCCGLSPLLDEMQMHI